MKISKLFQKKSSRTKHKILEMKQKTMMNYGGVNKLPNAKNRNVLASKLRPVKLSKVKNEISQEGGNSTTDGTSYI